MRRLIMLTVATMLLWGCARREWVVVWPPHERPVTKRPAATQPAKPQVRAWVPRPYPLDEVNLLAMGDWGSDNAHQRTVAQSLARYAASIPTQFNGVLSPGDNLYVELKKGVNDHQWQTLFEDMYDARYLNMPFYAVLGNHDYEGDKPRIQLEYARKNPDSRWKMPAKWYRLELPEESPLVTVLMLDSDRYKLSRREWASQILWLEEELARPRQTQWLVVCAHHPLFSNGLHGDNGLLQVEWGSLLEKYNVDFYVCGHEHNLQHLEIPGWPTSFVVAGAGGREKSKMRRSRGPFSRSIYGFVHMRFLDDRAIIRYVHGKDDQIVHEFERDPIGRVRVISTTKSDEGKLSLKPQKPFDESDKVSPFLPTMDPEPRPAKVVEEEE